MVRKGKERKGKEGKGREGKEWWWCHLLSLLIPNKFGGAQNFM
jgi:hypothetical protein